MRFKFVTYTETGHIIVAGGCHKILVISTDLKQIVQTLRLNQMPYMGTYSHGKLYMIDKNGMNAYEFSIPEAIDKNEGKKKNKMLKFLCTIDAPKDITNSDLYQSIWKIEKHEAKDEYILFLHRGKFLGCFSVFSVKTNQWVITLVRLREYLIASGAIIYP